MQDDKLRQEDEVLVLKSVYGENEVVLQGDVLTVNQHRFRLPFNYPSKNPPVVLSKHGNQSVMSELFIPGEEVLFKFIEQTRDQEAALKTSVVDDNEKAAELEKEETTSRENERHTEIENELMDGFVTGILITVNKSKFQAHASRCLTHVEAMQKVRYIQTKFSKATHNIWAYRLAGGQADNDDDGESAAGGRLAELLHLIDSKNVVVIVSRWYGGINVGPQRFKFILQAARSAIDLLPPI